MRQSNGALYRRGLITALKVSTCQITAHGEEKHDSPRRERPRGRGGYEVQDLYAETAPLAKFLCVQNYFF